MAFDEISTALEFSRIRETDAAIRCLVTPVSLQDVLERKRMLAPVWANLFTLADRERIAKAMTDRIKGQGSPSLVEWKDSIERAFAAAIDWRSLPEPLLNLADVEAPPDAGHLIWPLLARNQVNILLADQKSGKSYICLLLCALLASGEAGLAPPPLRVMAHGPAIYIDAETDVYAQRRRLERVAAGLKLRRLPDIHYRRIRPPITDHLATLRAEIARLGAVVAVVDSLTFAAGADLNSAETAALTMNGIGALGDTCTKLVTAHHNKAARQQGGETPSVMGSGLFEFKARNIWLVQKNGDADQQCIEQAWKHRYANDGPTEQGFGLRLGFNTSNTAVTFTPIEVGDSAWLAGLAGTHEDRIRSALQETELWKATTPQLASATGIDERQVRRICNRMPEIRLIAGDGTGGRSRPAVWEFAPTEHTASQNNGQSGQSGQDKADMSALAAAQFDREWPE